MRHVHLKQLNNNYMRKHLSPETNKDHINYLLERIKVLESKLQEYEKANNKPKEGPKVTNNNY